MNDLRRVPVITPNGKKIILVIDGNYIDGAEKDFICELIPIDAIVAVEDCPDDVIPLTYAGWKPE